MNLLCTFGVVTFHVAKSYHVIRADVSTLALFMSGTLFQHFTTFYCIHLALLENQDQTSQDQNPAT